jgi:hypothetical protein
MSEFPPFTQLAYVMAECLPDDATPIRWVLSEEFAAHLAEMAGLDREDESEPLELMGIPAAALPVARHWELLISRASGRLEYVRPA